MKYLLDTNACITCLRRKPGKADRASVRPCVRPLEAAALKALSDTRIDNSSTHGTPEVTAWLETPFIWTKPAAAIIRSHRRMLDRISHAVH